MSTRHILFELETLRTELLEKANNTSLNNLKVFLYFNYFEKILATNNPNYIEAFLKEFIDDYIHSISKFEVFGTNPNITKKIITQLKNLSLLSITTEKLNSFNSEIERIEKQLEKLNLILNGKDFGDGLEHKVFFPLIDNETPPVEHPYGKDFYGIIESVTIRINKTADNNKFIIVPSETELEKKIETQVKTSWMLALDLSKKYLRKLYKYHEVIINFDKRLGFYEGNSLGIALTISFLEQLLKFYNPAYIINIKERSAFTGGVNGKGKVLVTGEEIIKQKVKAIFFSEMNTFVIPKYEETYAYFALTQLKKDYPTRNLKLIPVEDINDVINRRDLVDIKKQKLVVRTGKFAKKNWMTVSLSIIVIGLIYFANLWDIDTNPAFLKNEKNWLIVQNKNNKILWKKRLGFDVTNSIFSTMPNITQKIVDIDRDGINEVILAREYRDKDQRGSPNGRITCFSNKGDIIWENHFNDEIKTKEMVHSKDYFSMIIDTVTINNTKALLCFADNVLYPAAVYFINVKNGKRTGSTLWNYGHLHSGKIGDFNRDGEKELIMFGLNNAFKRSIVFSIDIHKIEGQLPTDKQKGFIDTKPSKFNKYVLLPNTDYNKFLTGNYNSLLWGYFLLNQDTTRIINFLMEGKAPDIKGIMIELNGELQVTKIDPSLEFGIARDSLVSAGKLSLPYSFTEEYQKILYNQIEYWDGKRFVSKK